MRHKLTLLAATVAVALHAAPARAADSIPSVRVRVSDLDPGTEAGARALLARLRAAADTVCGVEPDLRALERQSRHHGCINDAVERALRQVRGPRAAAIAHRDAAFRVAAP